MAVTSAIESVRSATELQRLLAMHGYITTPDVAKVLYLALRLQKPLLLEGPPGAGKTQIAKVLSQALNMPLIRLQCYEGIDEAKALYQWNEPLQRMALEFVRQAGEHGSWAELKGHIYSIDFLIPGPILRALQSEERPVLLIDEIDKTGPAFEAFLLEILSDFQVSIPQLGAVIAQHRPIDRTRFAGKPKSKEYYEYGADRLSNSDLASLRLNEITGKHATQFAARNSTLAASTVNCGLRTLRRALNLAFEWGKLDKPVRIPLVKGERQRDRVLTDAEVKLYLENCRQPWKDAATLILGTGMRPGEVYRLRWEFALLNGSGGLIQVSEGKSKAARRLLPMIPDVYRMLKARHVAQKCPAEGWVFPSTAKCGHLEQGTAKTQHSAAVAKVNAEAIRANTKREAAGQTALPLPLVPFEPYVMRHTALTRMAPFCDAFTLARIAGHSSITITQRYCHPQADAVEAAFSKFGNRLELPAPTLDHQSRQ